MIRGFKHKGLETFFSTGSKAGIQAQHAERLRVLLGRLNVSVAPEDMNLRGLSLHQLKGNRKCTWAVKVVETGELHLYLSGKMPMPSITKIITEVHYAHA